MTKLLILIVTVTLFAACSRDPNVRKQKYLESGNRYFQKHDYRAASIQFLNAIQIDPKYTNAHYQLAETFLRLGDWEGAYHELSRTVDLVPHNLKAQIDLGNLLLGAREFDQAQQRAELVLREDPNNLDAHILKANALARLQQSDSSLDEMQTAIELDPERPTTYLNMAVLQISAKDAAAAEESLAKAVSLAPKSVVTRLALGNFYAEQQRWQDAEKQFRLAIDADPQNVAPRIALCTLLLAIKQNSQAVEEAIEAKHALKDSSAGQRLLGDLYFRIGYLSKALGEYAPLYKEHPKDLRVKKNYIQLLILHGELDQAAALNEQILKANPEDQEGVIARSQLLIQRGQAAEAVNQLRAFLTHEPDDPLVHYYLGLALDAIGDSGQAEVEWRETIRMDSRFVRAQTALAAIALRRGDSDDLTNESEAIISVRPNSPDGYIFRATAKALKRDEMGAEADFARAMKLAPQSPLGFAGMAQLRTSQKRYTDAEEFYQQALALDPNYTEAVQGLVSVLIAEKRIHQALEKVTEMIAKAPENSSYYVLQANLLLKRKPPEFDKAELALLKAADLNKSDASPLLLLAQLYTARGLAEQAIASAQEAIQHNPKDARAYFLRAVLEEQRGNWRQAQALYQKTLELQADFALASNNLAYLLLEHGGSSDTALSLAQDARQKLPDNPNVADTLAWAYFKQGTYNLAIDLLEEAVKKAPEDPSLHYHLGLAYQKINEKAKAKAHLLRVLQLAPSFEHVVDARSALAELRPS